MPNYKVGVIRGPKPKVPTPRQLQVLHYLALDWPYARIGQTIGVVETEVLHCIRQLAHKWHCHQYDVVSVALRAGYVFLDFEN